MSDVPNHEKPDGLAYNKKKILQINGRRDEPHTIFEYYTEYGDEGVVGIHCEGNVIYVPLYAVIGFASKIQQEIS